jgi:hypothetical protein
LHAENQRTGEKTSCGFSACHFSISELDAVNRSTFTAIGKSGSSVFFVVNKKPIFNVNVYAECENGITKKN